MTSKLKILLSGPGLIGKKHAQLVQTRADCDLAAIVAPDRGRNREFASANGADFYSDFRTGLDESGADAVIVSSPNEFHYAQTLDCIARKVPALVEKPVTDKLADARDLAALSEREGVPVLVGHHRAHSNLLDVASNFIRSPKFGNLVAVQGSALFYKPADYFRDGAWRTRVGGGPILINLIHEIGLLRHFCGEIATVFAQAGHSIRGFEVEDTVSLSFRFENGALGTFILSDAAASSKSWEMTSGENGAYPHFPAQDCYHFAGTNGSLDFPSMHARFYPGEDGRSWWKPFEDERLSFVANDPLERQLDHFIQVIRGEMRPAVSATEAYRNMQVIEAIGASIASRSVIELAGFGA